MENSKDLFENRENLIGFKSNEIWTLNDLQKFTGSITEIYSVFSAIKIKENQEKRKSSNYKRILEDYDHYFHKYLDHPMYFEFYELQRRIIKDYISGKIKNLPNLQFFPVTPFPKFEEDIKQQSIFEIYSDISSYQSSDELIRIYRIKMASPGGFSFQGIGEILKEIREFIKDIWYRNKQDRICGQLEIIDKYLAIKDKYENSNSNLPPASNENEIRKILNNNVNNLKQLEKENKLIDIGKNIDYVPE